MRRRALLLSAAGVLLAAGCGSSPESDPASAPAFAQPKPSASVPASGPSSADKPDTSVPATLAFGGKTLDGAAFDAATLAGKPTILWFWAPWCATCASEAQSVRDLQDEYGTRLNFLGVAGMGGNKEMHQFVSDLEVGNVTHLDDQAGKIWKKFRITEQSTYVVLDRGGDVVERSYLDDLQLTARVKSLVA
ncbi:redoxin family protein [Actinoplanes sp. URMC 104]|uniref:TlpA family protein disulfide reductase n=1 Tax=Actinoplanes sp. URMC 104 TaxID=3423409 RepID=UPI003F1ACA1E